MFPKPKMRGQFVAAVNLLSRVTPICGNGSMPFRICRVVMAPIFGNMPNVKMNGLEAENK